MKRTGFGFILFILVLGSVADAQTRKLRWESEGGMCRFEGSYNSRKYTAAQLKNTLKLMNGYFRLDTFNATVFKYEDIAKLDFAPIEADYQKKSSELKNLDFVRSPFWEKRRRQQLKELESYYWLSKTTIASYKTPVSLLDYPGAEFCKTTFGEPLIAGGDRLLNTWQTFNVESRKKNGYPEEVKRKFDAERRSPDRLQYARIEITTFGWWNCVNNLIDQGDEYAVLDRNFRKLFIRIKTIYCEEA